MPFSQNCKFKKPYILLVFLLATITVTFAEPKPFLHKGDCAPIVGLKNLSGSEQSFPQKGSWNIVFFWSLFCHTCIEEIPVIAEDLEAFKTQPVHAFFVSLDTEKMKKGVENFLQKRNLQIPVLLEEIASESFKAADQWGVKTTPAAFLVDPEGKVAFSHEGPFNPDEMLSLLKSGLGNRQGDPKTPGH